MAVNKKKREEEKEKRKRKDSPQVVGMSVQFEQHTNARRAVRTLFERMERVYNMSEHCSKCSNIAKQGQIVRTVFEQHTNTRRAV